MKNLMYKTLVVVITIFTTTLISCDKDDDSSNNNDNNNNQQASLLADQVRDTAESGTWRITRFEEDGRDETSDYNGYSFSFNADGNLIATNGTNTVNGTWSVTVDSSSSDSSDDDSSSDDSDDVDFNIFFVSPPDFEELSDDWDIISRSDTKIELIDISGGNGGTDYLTFEKN